MIHFKAPKNGFTLIEVLISLFIVSAILVPVFILQGRILKTIDSYATAIQASIYMNSLFNEQRLEASIEASNAQIVIEKKNQNPLMTIRYECKKPPSGSTLGNLDNVYLETTTGEWTDLKGLQQETMISCIFKPNQKQP